MTSQELWTARAGGASVAPLAQERNVEFTKVVDAAVTAHATATRGARLGEPPKPCRGPSPWSERGHMRALDESMSPVTCDCLTLSGFEFGLNTAIDQLIVQK